MFFLTPKKYGLGCHWFSGWRCARNEKIEMSKEDKRWCARIQASEI